MTDGDSERDKRRGLTAYNLLMELATLAAEGKIYVVDGYANKSSSDPYRMNVEFKTVRGDGQPLAGPAVVRTPDGSGVAPMTKAAMRVQDAESALARAVQEAKQQNMTAIAMREVQVAQAALEQALKTQKYKQQVFRSESLTWPEGVSNVAAAILQPAVPPSRPVDRSKGARELDLD
jgi:hypothetical protein